MRPVGTPEVDTALKLWVVLARAFDAVERHSRSSIARFGLGSTEFGVLEVLYHKGELPVCEVQRRILVESSSTTYVVDKLVARGLVERQAGAADRRVTLLRLTAAGRRLISGIFPAHRDAMRHAVGALASHEQGRVIRALRVLGKGATARLERKPPEDRAQTPRPRAVHLTQGRGARSTRGTAGSRTRRAAPRQLMEDSSPKSR